MLDSELVMSLWGTVHAVPFLKVYLYQQFVFLRLELEKKNNTANLQSMQSEVKYCRGQWESSNNYGFT